MFTQMLGISMYMYVTPCRIPCESLKYIRFYFNMAGRNYDMFKGVNASDTCV